MILHDYQLKGVDLALSKRGTAQALDMGMGKTAISIECIKRVGCKAIVIAPLRPALITWPDELKKWDFKGTWGVAHGPDKFDVVRSNPDVLIVPFSSLKWFYENFKFFGFKWDPHMQIVDESSMVKDHTTKRFKMLKKMEILTNEYKLNLSATPMPNGAHELWPQYFLLDKGRLLGKTVSAFRDEWCQSFTIPGTFITKYSVPAHRLEKLYDTIAPVTYRLKASDYLTMPEIIYNYHQVDLPAKAQAVYNKMEDIMYAELEHNNFVMAESAVTAAMKLRQIVQGGVYYEHPKWEEVHTAKLEALIDILSVNEGRNVIIVFQFQFEVEIIQRVIGDIPVVRSDNQDLIRDWNDGKIPVMLAHPASISHGINLQEGGSYILWYGIPWSLEQYQQLNGRVFRQGQKHGVVINHLVASNTIDEAVVKSLASKEAGQETLLTYLKEYRHV